MIPKEYLEPPYNPFGMGPQTSVNINLKLLLIWSSVVDGLCP
jgi:hypothetical protein